MQEWVKKAPTEAGWYWYYWDEVIGVEIFRVFVSPNGVNWAAGERWQNQSHNRMIVLLEDLHGYWRGPIIVPEPPQKRPTKRPTVTQDDKAVTSLDGDNPCVDCGTADNITWFTDNVLWNDIAPDGGILCIRCFVKRAGDTGYDPLSWRLLPEWERTKKEQSSGR